MPAKAWSGLVVKMSSYKGKFWVPWRELEGIREAALTLFSHFYCDVLVDGGREDESVVQ